MPAFVAFQNVTFFMIIPSTILTILLLYIAIKASTTAMKKYKYIIILVMLSVYQFDFVDSVLLCPINLYKFVGLQFYGVLGTVPRKMDWGTVNVSADSRKLENIPWDGYYLALLYIFSLTFFAISIMISFVWREFALPSFKKTFVNIFLHGLQILIFIGMLIGQYPFYSKLGLPEFQFLKLVGTQRPSFPDLERAIYLVADVDEFHVASAFRGYFCYVLVTTLVGLSFIVKAVIRITVPILMFAVPLIIGILFGYINYFFKIFPLQSVEQPAAQLGAVLIAIPSFFSTCHVFIVIYFTRPFREYLKNMIGIKFSVQSLEASNISFNVRNAQSRG